jgi:DNA primase small subunit
MNDFADIDIEDLGKIDMTFDDPKTIHKVPEKNPVSKQNLELYYSNIFPFKHFFRWLSNENSEVFERREFSFTLENDIYVRFQSYKNDEDFKKETLRGLPHKIDIGAIYNTLPKYHNSVINNDSKGFQPVQKEMVFDIDMTDYDDIRTCCQKAKICNKCWKFMEIAYKIINVILTDDFGFEKILWVFSGRRGIHCWVSDDRAKNLTNEGRSAIANYIKYKIYNSKTGQLSTLREPIHPSIE